jgi:hypothetical protein
MNSSGENHPVDRIGKNLRLVFQLLLPRPILLSRAMNTGLLVFSFKCSAWFDISPVRLSVGYCAQRHL